MKLRGLKAIFMTDSPPFDKTTAKFGFVTRATTTREIANGPLVIISREGMTRISFTPCPVLIAVGRYYQPFSFDSSLPDPDLNTPAAGHHR